MTIKRRIERLETTAMGAESAVYLHFVNNWEPDPAPPVVPEHKRVITVRFVRPDKYSATMENVR